MQNGNSSRTFRIQWQHNVFDEQTFQTKHPVVIVKYCFILDLQAQARIATTAVAWQ